MRLIITTAAIASVGGVILYNFFLKGREKNNGKDKRIIVASTSELKVNAAMKAANASVRNVLNVNAHFFSEIIITHHSDCERIQSQVICV